MFSNQNHFEVSEEDHTIAIGNAFGDRANATL
jgi:hypothetical protein